MIKKGRNSIVNSLKAVNASRGNFTVHNARTKVDNFLGRNVMKSETGDPGHIAATCGTSTITKVS
jgi:hypothetical protein